MAKRTTRKTSGRKATTRKASTRKTSTRKASTRKASTRKTAAKAAPKAAKIPSASKPRSKSEIYGLIAENNDLTRKQVAGVFDTLGQIIAADLKNKNLKHTTSIPGMMKIVMQRKPATKARKGVNPFTGEQMMFKAKPARNVVKIRPLKGLKEMV